MKFRIIRIIIMARGGKTVCTPELHIHPLVRIRQYCRVMPLSHFLNIYSCYKMSCDPWNEN